MASSTGTATTTITRTGFSTRNLNFGDLAYQGDYSHFQNQNNENNSSIALNADKKATSWLQLNGSLGIARQFATYTSGSVGTTSLVAAGIYNPTNSAVPL